MVCLDSDIIINFLRNDIATKEKIKDLQEKGLEISTTSINTFEVYRGFIDYKKDSLKEFEKFLLNLKIFNFNLESSKKAAEIFEDLKSKGESLDLADILIASIVIANNETFMTRNVNHFNRISGLELSE